MWTYITVAAICIAIFAAWLTSRLVRARRRSTRHFRRVETMVKAYDRLQHRAM